MDENKKEAIFAMKDSVQEIAMAFDTFRSAAKDAGVFDIFERTTLASMDMLLERGGWLSRDDTLFTMIKFAEGPENSENCEGCHGSGCEVCCDAD